MEPIEDVTYDGCLYKVGKAELREYNDIFFNKVYFKAFEQLKEDESYNAGAWKIEKI